MIMKKVLFYAVCLLMIAPFTLISCGSDETVIINYDYLEDASLGLNMKMVYVGGGAFQMGAITEQDELVDDDEHPVHTVTLDSYYISATEVTQAQWELVMGTTIYQQKDKAEEDLPSEKREEYEPTVSLPTPIGSFIKSKINYFDSVELYDEPVEKLQMRGVGADSPMYYVSWEEAQAFCRKLSELTGLTYALPSEAQWEYAARGGSKSKGNFYSGGLYAVDAVAWYEANSEGRTHPVSKKRVNELGLYDMSGNVSEWCGDWCGKYYPTGLVTQADMVNVRVMRGGSFALEADACTVLNRITGLQTGRYDNTGFRVVRIIENKEGK